MICFIIFLFTMLFIRITIITKDYLYFGMALGLFAMYVGIYLAGGSA